MSLAALESARSCALVESTSSSRLEATQKLTSRSYTEAGGLLAHAKSELHRCCSRSGSPREAPRVATQKLLACSFSRSAGPPLLRFVRMGEKAPLSASEESDSEAFDGERWGATRKRK